MRILHVVPYYADAWAYGGIPRVASAMARGLARRGHQVTVCTTDAADSVSRAPAEPGQADGVDVRVFRNLSNHAAYHWQFFTPVGLRAFLMSVASSYDVGHIHACHNLPGTIAADALQRAGVPYIVSPNGTALRIERRRAAKLAFQTLFGRRLLPGASRVIAVTEAERRQLHRAGVRDSRICLLPNPIDLQEFARGPNPRRFRQTYGTGDDRLILYLGQLTPRKGVDVLVRAFSRLAPSDTRLVIAGDDRAPGDGLANAIRDSGCQERIVRVGLLRGAARLDALAAADVVVYPSRDEIFGLVPLEALLCGRPVIVGDDSGCAEVLGTTGGGRTVPHGSAAALAAAVEHMLAEHPVWTGRARAAAAIVRSLFDADIICRRLESLYGEVCA